MSLALQSLICLSKLNLNFSFCPGVDQNILKSLAQGLENLTTLTSLKLNFTQCSFIDVKNLFEKFIDEEGFFDLSQSLKNLTSLQVFEFALTHQFVKFGFPSFFEALTHLTNLSKLVLNFSQSKDIQDEDLKLIAESLKKLQNLESLELNLRFSLQITDSGLRDLASCLGNLQSLKFLNLNIFGCNNITQEGVDFLKSQLAQLEYLKEKNLNFPNAISSSGFMRERPQIEADKSTCSLI